MATDDDTPSELIKRIFRDRQDGCLDVGLGLLRALADSLGNIIGDSGFDSLLARAARRVATDHPWLQLARCNRADPEWHWFRQSFDGQSAADICSACSSLLTVFVDILTVLIGGHLTTLILENAIGHASAGKKGKEQDNG